MNLLLFHSTPSHNLLQFSSQFKPKTPTPIIKPISISAHSLPARDRVIDFGKHKGKMLGTLPSNYLKWVSKNLRARDFEDWAKLADEVLEDPVYRDRIEWEFADKVLNGDLPSTSQSRPDSGVSELVEISQRFGWDNDDKVGWGRIDFALLGTSKGGRIPRVSESSNGGGERKLMRLKREKVGGCDGGEKRRERRERVRLKRSGGSRLGGMGIQGKGRVRFDDDDDDDDEEVGVEREKKKMDDDRTVESRSPFPGREALLKKVLFRRSLYNNSG
ncbi:uncharacterized protein LOC132286431 [Cornus florida]|uniref:uncharacterized protein LOC132286431 n=1 Tax=Cornus florida TaxID=4283 RepID=UPI00289D95F3|nr:uncharacterized protein LOC132286431 [Cornus florida]